MLDRKIELIITWNIAPAVLGLAEKFLTLLLDRRRFAALSGQFGAEESALKAAVEGSPLPK